MTQHSQITEFSQRPQPRMDVIRRGAATRETGPVPHTAGGNVLRTALDTPVPAPSLAYRQIRIRRLGTGATRRCWNDLAYAFQHNTLKERAHVHPDHKGDSEGGGQGSNLPQCLRCN